MRLGEGCFDDANRFEMKMMMDKLLFLCEIVSFMKQNCVHFVGEILIQGF